MILRLKEVWTAPDLKYNKKKVFMYATKKCLCVLKRWEDNIKMDLQEVGGGFGYWMELAQDRDR
jgi:hypothetical protein